MFRYSGFKTSRRSLDLFNSSTRDVVTQFIGIHPQFAETEDVASFIELFHRNSQSIDGIGEIGLDYVYTEHNVGLYQKQKEVFNSMLSLAETTKKPVSIHSRNP